MNVLKNGNTLAAPSNETAVSGLGAVVLPDVREQLEAFDVSDLGTLPPRIQDAVLTGEPSKTAGWMSFLDA